MSSTPAHFVVSVLVIGLAAVFQPIAANAQDIPILPAPITSCLEEPREPGSTVKIIRDDVSVSSSGDVVRDQACVFWPAGSDPATDVGTAAPFRYQLGNIGAVD